MRNTRAVRGRKARRRARIWIFPKIDDALTGWNTHRIDLMSAWRASDSKVEARKPASRRRSSSFNSLFFFGETFGEPTGALPDALPPKKESPKKLRKSMSWDQLRELAKLTVGATTKVEIGGAPVDDAAAGAAAVAKFREALRVELGRHPVEEVVAAFFREAAARDGAAAAAKAPWSSFRSLGVDAAGLRRAAKLHGCELSGREADLVCGHFGGVLTRRALRAFCEGACPTPHRPRVGRPRRTPPAAERPGLAAPSWRRRRGRLALPQAGAPHGGQRRHVALRAPHPGRVSRAPLCSRIPP